jgi:hypothetical protein
MGLLDDAKKQLDTEQAQAEAKLSAESEAKAWAAVGASKTDIVAYELNAEEELTIKEFISAVPEVCWEGEEFSTLAYSTSLIQPNPSRIRIKPIKYQAPDKTVRLSQGVEYHGCGCVGGYYTSKSPPYPSSYGEQRCLKIDSPPAVLFKDGIFFHLFANFQRFPSKDEWVKNLSFLLKEGERIKERERENIIAQQERWQAQGLCQHCGGKLSLFGKKCKVCGKQN